MGRNWAITIGINDYYNLQPLRYAVRDGAAMGDLFRQELGFEQVYHFADDAPPLRPIGGRCDRNPPLATSNGFSENGLNNPF